MCVCVLSPVALQLFGVASWACLHSRSVLLERLPATCILVWDVPVSYAVGLLRLRFSKLADVVGTSSLAALQTELQSLLLWACASVTWQCLPTQPTAVTFAVQAGLDSEGGRQRRRESNVCTRSRCLFIRPFAAAPLTLQSGVAACACSPGGLVVCLEWRGRSEVACYLQGLDTSCSAPRGRQPDWGSSWVDSAVLLCWCGILRFAFVFVRHRTVCFRSAQCLRILGCLMQRQARPGPGSVRREVCFGALRASAQTRHLGRDGPECPARPTTQRWLLQCSSVRLSSSVVCCKGTWLLVLHAPWWLVLQARRVCLSHTHAQHGTDCACLLVCGAHARVSQGVVAAAVSLGLPVPAAVIDFQGRLIRITVPPGNQEKQDTADCGPPRLRPLHLGRAITTAFQGLRCVPACCLCAGSGCSDDVGTRCNGRLCTQPRNESCAPAAHLAVCSSNRHEGDLHGACVCLQCLCGRGTGVDPLDNGGGVAALCL